MRFVVLCAVFCTFGGVVLSFPSPNVNANGQMGNDKVRIQKMLKAIDFMEIGVRDWMTDTIDAILGIGVGELLSQINLSLEELEYLIQLCVTQLNGIVNQLDAATQQELRNIINNALRESMTIISPILKDLGLVLPTISPRRTNKINDAAELIRAILGISLEELLIKITRVMEQSNELLGKTMAELSRIADRILDSQVSTALHAISNEYLGRGRSILLPILNNLYKVLPSRNLPEKMIASVISESIGIDVPHASMVLDDVIMNLEEDMSNFVKDINYILRRHNDHVREEFLQIVETGLEDIENNMQPILNVFLQYLPSDDKTTYRTYDVPMQISETLLGISLEDFLTYMDYAFINVKEVCDETALQLRNASMQFDKPITFQLLSLVDQIMLKMDLTVKPFIETISPLLGERRWISTQEFLEMYSKPSPIGHERLFVDYSFRFGHNKEFILHLISKIMLFDIVDAAEEFKAALYNLDSLYSNTLEELNQVLYDAHPYVISEVNRIIELAINDSHKTIQPISDILLRFLPIDHYHDNDYISGILDTISRLKFPNFRDFLKFSVCKINSIAEHTALSIHYVTQGRGRIHNEINGSPSDIVDEIVLRTLRISEVTIEPFVNIIAPILQVDALVDYNVQCSDDIYKYKYK